MNKMGGRIISFVLAKEYYILLSVIALVLFSGVIYSFLLGKNLQYSDECDYYTLAINLLSKHQYTLDGEHLTGYRPPGYPLVLSIFVFLGGGVVLLRILNFIAFSCCIYLLYLILKKHAAPFAGLIGAGLVVCYPVLFYAAGTLYPQILGALLFLLILFLLSQWRINSIVPFILVGLIFGYLILVIPNFVFSLLVVVFWVVFSQRKIRVKAALIITFVAFLVVALWSARHYKVFNSFVFVATNSGYNLLLGNSENTTSNSGVNVDISKYSVNITGMDEVELDSYYRSKAIEFVCKNKLQATKLYFLKVINNFNFCNELATKTEVSSKKNVIMILTYGPLLILFFLRMLSIRRFKPSTFELLLIILYLLNAFFSAIFFTRVRFRLPFDFLLIIIVAMYIYHLLSTKNKNFISNVSVVPNDR